MYLEIVEKCYIFSLWLYLEILFDAQISDYKGLLMLNCLEIICISLKKKTSASVLRIRLLSIFIKQNQKPKAYLMVNL